MSSMSSEQSICTGDLVKTRSRYGSRTFYKEWGKWWMHDASNGLKSYMLYADELCIYLGKADDSVIGCFFCIPRCQVVFVEIGGMQVVLCCS